METSSLATRFGDRARVFGNGAQDEMVELALLLPASRAEALLDLSRQRRESVAQTLRALIDRALAAEG
ncbi:MAG TPA: hypothetical protein VG406_03060 [Isosphaeraceae bacterium]|jgi:hypothetical protein|nr:hypothetical protein [Isosphaeraceae bacterium]